MTTNIAFKNNILIVCNIINVIYHVPQIVKTYRTKSVKDFDPYYLFLGNLHSLCWVMYSISDNNYLMLFNSCITVFSISFVSYYKITSYISEYYNKNNLSNLAINSENTDTDTNTDTNNHKIIIVNNGE